MTTGKYEVLAIRYATHMRKGRENFISMAGIQDLHDADMPIDFFVWVIRNDEHTVVVDTGFTATAGNRRNRKIIAPVDEALKSVGVHVATVKHVVITHLHFDHAGALSMFPEAEIYLQEAEMAYATGKCMCEPFLRAPFEVEDVVTMVRRVYDGRVRFICGAKEILPGISLHHAPGHTPGLQCVRVATERGNVVLASDASHYYENFRRGNPFPVLTDAQLMVSSWGYLKELADSEDHIIPGHDPTVMEIYPRADTTVSVALLHKQPNFPS